MTQMHRYVALLRAVNVGGTSLIKMADLKAQCEAFGLANVKTYIESGNVILDSHEDDPERLAAGLAEHLAKTLGYTGAILILTPPQLREALEQNPFRAQLDEGGLYCHILFLAYEPAPANVDVLMALKTEEYTFAVRGRALYYTYPARYAGHRRTIDWEGILGVRGTARTCKVVAKLAELAEAA